MPRPLRSLAFALAAVPCLLAAGATMADPIPHEELANATFVGIEAEPITLADGEWTGTPYAGGMAAPSARLQNLTAYGDLDGDGTDETVALLVYSGGGTGQFLYVAVFREVDGAPQDVANAEIGDRNPVRALSVEGGRIVLDIVTQGPDDGACCATQKARVTLALQGDALTILSTENQGTIDIADLDGTWTLAALDYDGEPPLPDTTITATFEKGAVSGNAGCNIYSGSLSPGADGPAAVTIGPLATTMMACTDAVMAQERAYFDRLNAVDLWAINDGRLLLSYTLGDQFGTLVFTRSEDE